MDTGTIHTLIELNRRFYDQFSAEFAMTRLRLQNGVRRTLAQLPDEGRWLDLGCGAGALAVEWLKAGRCSHYLGLDFSPALLAEARRALALLPDESTELPDCSPVALRRADLADPGWARGLEPGFRGALSFAVLHHLPSVALRQRVLRQVHNLLYEAEGILVLSVWQFQNSPKLMERRLPWAEAGLDEAQLEPGDTLLDWRFASPGKTERRGLRYVHLFDRDELAALAELTGFRVVDEFHSDGQGGRLALYQTWQRT